MYILHIMYEVELAPNLDYNIFQALEGSATNIDCMRDDEIRDIYVYLETEIELESAQTLLLTNGLNQLTNTDEECCLLDFIRINALKKTKYQEDKLKLRKRIAEIYQKELLKYKDDNTEN